MNPVLQNLGRGALGMAFLVFVCYLLSTNRSAINWKLVLFGILAQIMFAIGVMHTTVGGQPVFWMMFGLVLLYTIGRKLVAARSGTKPLEYDTKHLGLTFLWQVVLVLGLIFATRLFGTWANLVITLSVVAILVQAFRMGTRYPELLKWNILIS